jgi:hypothetical protein
MSAIFLRLTCARNLPNLFIFMLKVLDFQEITSGKNYPGPGIVREPGIG